MSPGLTVAVLSFLGVFIALLATFDQFQCVRDIFLTYIPLSSYGRTQTYSLFTKEELAKHNGEDGSKIYLAILGDVFDVSKGKRHYGKDGGYSFFAGRDGTRAYVSGDFTDKGLIEDTSGLSNTDLLGLEEWNQFYKRDYKHIGRLIGHFYDVSGLPTEAMKNFEQQLIAAKEAKQVDKDDRKLFPPCNVESRQGAGRRIWCTNLSGGVQRDWVGVPRQYFQPGKTEPRCACVKDIGSPSRVEPGIQHINRGDLDNPQMKVYDGCEPTSFQCYFED